MRRGRRQVSGTAAGYAGTGGPRPDPRFPDDAVRPRHLERTSVPRPLVVDLCRPQRPEYQRTPHLAVDGPPAALSEGEVYRSGSRPARSTLRWKRMPPSPPRIAPTRAATRAMIVAMTPPVVASPPIGSRGKP